jgi:hypothetical protein
LVKEEMAPQDITQPEAAAVAVDTMAAVAERQRKTTDPDGLPVVVVARPFLEELRQVAQRKE